MKSIKLIFKKNNIFILYFILSSFFIGGENLTINYLFVPLLLYIFYKSKELIIKKYDYYLIGITFFIFLYNIIIQNYNFNLIKFLFFSLGFIFLKNIKFNKKLFINLFISSGIIHSIILYIQFITGNSRPPSTFVNTNFAAVWVVISLFFLIFKDNYFKKNKLIWYFLSIFIFIASTLTLSRTLFVLYLIFGLFILFKINNKKKKITLIILLLLGLSLLFVFVGTRKQIEQRKFSRINIYKSSIEMFLDKPFVGHGVNNVKNLLPGYFDGVFNGFSYFSKTPRMSHSIYLEIILKYGVIIFVLISIIFLKYYKHLQFKIPIILWLSSGLFNNIEKSFSLLLLFFILLSFNNLKKEKKQIDTFFTGLILFIVIYIFGLNLISYYLDKNGKYYFRKKMYYRANQYLSNAYKLNKIDPFYIKSYLNFLIEVPSIKSLNLSWDDRFYKIEKTFENFNKFDKYNPKVYNIYTYYCIKILKSDYYRLFNKEILNRALNNIDKALKYNPNNPNFYYKKMFLLTLKNENKKAIKYGKKALKLEPNYLKVYEKLITLVENKDLKNKYKNKISEIKQKIKNRELTKHEKNLIK